MSAQENQGTDEEGAARKPPHEIQLPVASEEKDRQAADNNEIENDCEERGAVHTVSNCSGQWPVASTLGAVAYCLLPTGHCPLATGWVAAQSATC